LQIVEAEWFFHPRMTAIDLQKLVYQAAFGMDHLLEDRKQFEQCLRREWDQLGGMEGGLRQRPLQIIDPMGKTARLHLRPCKVFGIDPEGLSAFLIAQPAKGGTKEAFDFLWHSVMKLAREGRIPFREVELTALSFPVVPPRHSLDYGPAAYRVVHDVTHPNVAAWLRENVAER
jgi:hypothetical protein